MIYDMERPMMPRITNALTPEEREQLLAEIDAMPLPDDWNADFRRGFEAGYMYGRIDEIRGREYDDRVPGERSSLTEVVGDWRSRQANPSP